MYIYINTILCVTQCLSPVWKTALSLVIIDILQIVNYATNAIQFQGRNKNFLCLFYEKIYQKNFIFILCLIRIDRYRLYLTNTGTTTRYHKNRPIPPIPILKYLKYRYKYLNTKVQGRSQKKIERGPNFATFDVTSFTYNGVLPYVNYARRCYINCCTKLRQCECHFTDLM